MCQIKATYGLEDFEHVALGLLTAVWGRHDERLLTPHNVNKGQWTGARLGPKLEPRGLLILMSTDQLAIIELVRGELCNRFMLGKQRKAPEYTIR